METVNTSNTVPAKIPRIAVYISEEVKTDLEKLAFSERRSTSAMAAILIEEALKARGYLVEELKQDSSP
ncbi:MAG: hypothetical protein NW224_00250 [Leptolyngbyaceae cyanobacterium bins.302]|nr:hypothetical protein [Leptolyngbyaceae cyanobacterium bins.302]